MPLDFVHELPIGNVRLKNNIVLAPMAGFTDMAFRRLCKECGVGLTVTEMVSVNGLDHRNEKTKVLLRRFDGEIPCALQLFGSDPDVFLRVLENCGCLSEFEIIDINMGCPMPKVTRLGAGSALLKDSAKAGEIVRACVEGGKGRPVTVKMRLGIENSHGCEKFADELMNAGASAITVHGRTVRQLYGGFADWDAIKRIKLALKIPVIGNGDIAAKEDLRQKVAYSGVDGIMIGRGCLGRPQLFCEITKRGSPSVKTCAMRHLDYMNEYFSENYAVVNFRKHIAHYLKGIPNGRELKSKMNAATNLKELKSLLSQL